MVSRLKEKGCLFLASSLCDGVEDNDIKQVTTLLLNKEANPNTLIPSYGVTPFHLVIGNDSEAFAEEVTKLFLRHGGNPNVRSTEGLTPVHVAAAWGRVAVLELLLANGGNPLCLDDEGRSPFHYAFDGKYYQAIVVLGKYCDNPTRPPSSCKITLDKVVIDDGSTIAEYTAAEIPAGVSQSHKNLLNSRLRNVDDSETDADELENRRQMDKEKSLVNEIIVKLSNSLKSEAAKEERDGEASWSSAISSDASNSYGTSKLAFALKMKARRRPVTPKYRRQNANLPLAQNNNLSKPPLIAAYDPNDTIISRSPNFLATTRATPKRETFFSPTVANSRDRASRHASFTPCATGTSQPFRFDELHLGKETARSTPRRRRRFFRQPHSSLNKLRRNRAAFRSSESHDSTTNSSSLSPEQNLSANKFDYRLNANLAIKLHESKYDDDDDDAAGIDCKKENEPGAQVEKREAKREPMEDLGNDSVGSNPGEGKKADATDPSGSVNACRDTLSTLLSSFRSACSVRVQEQYRIEDKDEGIAFLERRTYTLPPCKTPDCTSPGNTWPRELNLTTIMNLSNSELRRRLRDLGDDPGPITFSTRHVYCNRLMRLETRQECSMVIGYRRPPMETQYRRPPSATGYRRPSVDDSTPHFPMPTGRTDFLDTLANELDEIMNFHPLRGRTDFGATPDSDSEDDSIPHFPMPSGSRHFGATPGRGPSARGSRSNGESTGWLRYGDWVNNLEEYRRMENDAFAEFENPDPAVAWRGGTSKTNFTYLLLDPRVTRDLPHRAHRLEESTIWNDFVSAIFYVGKGTRNRPYSHLKDAFDAWTSRRDRRGNRKIDKILEIWNSDSGVVCLQVFQNTISEEAHTREAAMIDVLQLQTVTNTVRGCYYGVAETWSHNERRELGRYLLYRAMKIFLAEGERQLLPQNL